ncbi:hypothetical protein SDC9_140633 [bioreactor metagenome]|uniref:Uncharacterized protein n=1 Tax=bioreactor metagenome TaxID=1076179 RepID=A0A645DW12_9ZZZZ
MDQKERVGIDGKEASLKIGTHSIIDAVDAHLRMLFLKIDFRVDETQG